MVSFNFSTWENSLERIDWKFFNFLALFCTSQNNKLIYITYVLSPHTFTNYQKCISFILVIWIRLWSSPALPCDKIWTYHNRATWTWTTLNTWNCLLIIPHNYLVLYVCWCLYEVVCHIILLCLELVKKFVCGGVVWWVECKPILVFSLAQAE